MRWGWDLVPCMEVVVENGLEIKETRGIPLTLQIEIRK